MTYMRFPFFCGGAFLDNYEIGLSIIRMEVNDAEENIFLLNYFLCDALLRGLKEYFPMSKTVFVVHDQIWTERLLGDIEKFKTIMNEKIVINIVMTFFVSCYNEKPEIRLVSCKIS